MKLRILIAGLLAGVAMFAAETGAELFQKAVTQERAAGNLEEAIKLYQRVAKEFASDRALAAKALVQEARCYEKLGQDKALKLYEQVARDFKDQRDPAAAANARLATLRQGDRGAATAAMTARKIGVAFPEIFSVDGQHFIFEDHAAGAVAVSDVAGANKRVIFKGKPGDRYSMTPSNDFSMGLLYNSSKTDEPMLLIKTDGSGSRELGRRDGDWGQPSWSWDNRYVLVVSRSPDGSSRLLKITVADGQRMEVLRRENAVISSARFSPDGRFIAYSEGPMNSSKVFVLPSQGGEPRLVSSDATFVDWTRDGRYLAINSGNPDSRALYLLPVKDGQSAGEPVFIRNGSIDWGKTTADGSLFYAAFPPPDAAVSLGTIDPEGHPVNWKRLNLMTGINVFPEPKWSMDSSQIAYLAINVQAGQGGFTVRLRNIASGEDRELYRAATAAPLCVWAAHDTKLYCGEAGRSSTEILSVSVDSGHVERLASLPGMFDVLRIAPDDSALYLGAMKVTGIQWNSVSLVRWQIATHRQTALGDGKDISPDERWVWGEDSASGPQTDPAFRYAIRLRPAIGADWRPVGKLSPRANATHPEQLDFTTDGNWLYFHDSDSSGKDGLFRAPTAGGQPVRMGDFPSHSFLGTIKISPDGRKIIVNTPESELNHPELWLLANFVPKQQAAR